MNNSSNAAFATPTDVSYWLTKGDPSYSARMWRGFCAFASCAYNNFELK